MSSTRRKTCCTPPTVTYSSGKVRTRRDTSSGNSIASVVEKLNLLLWTGCRPRSLVAILVVCRHSGRSSCVHKFRPMSLACPGSQRHGRLTLAKGCVFQGRGVIAVVARPVPVGSGILVVYRKSRATEFAHCTTLRCHRHCRHQTSVVCRPGIG